MCFLLIVAFFAVVLIYDSFTNLKGLSKAGKAAYFVMFAFSFIVLSIFTFNPDFTPFAGIIEKIIDMFVEVKTK